MITIQHFRWFFVWKIHSLWTVEKKDRLTAFKWLNRNTWLLRLDFTFKRHSTFHKLLTRTWNKIPSVYTEYDCLNLFWITSLLVIEFRWIMQKVQFWTLIQWLQNAMKSKERCEVFYLIIWKKRSVKKMTKFKWKKINFKKNR